ncbi:hypothetical protein J6590_012628 [Homalodisca vitripennis]|nr:hypothetical protein J6590_012628 [Homalodisca vitripennis]
MGYSFSISPTFSYPFLHHPTVRVNEKYRVGRWDEVEPRREARRKTQGHPGTYRYINSTHVDYDCTARRIVRSIFINVSRPDPGRVWSQRSGSRTLTGGGVWVSGQRKSRRNTQTRIS